MPAHCGVERLVPPALSQLGTAAPGDITATYWPVAGSALKATSATARRASVPTPGTVLACQAGVATNALTPPPVDDQPVSAREPAPAAVNVVPPTATTRGETAGHDTAAPESPVAAR
jgi:hypothetical protein